jgi:acetyl esterase/lipase
MFLLAGMLGRAAAADFPTAAAPVLSDHYPVHKQSFADGVTGYGDLVYSSLPGYRPLTLDVFVPAQKPGPTGFPLAIYIHGGGWMAGHSRQSASFEDWPAVLAALAAKGYVVASLNYRLSGEAKFPGAIVDVKNAIRWLRGHHDKYGIDKTRIAVWGGSAGGHLAALAATSCNVEALAPPVIPGPPGAPAASPSANESDCVQAAAIWYGVFDMEASTNRPRPAATANQPPAPAADANFLGCQVGSCPAASLKAASPVTFISKQTPPMLLIHGEADDVVPVSQSIEFHKALSAKGGQVELVIIKGVNHSFIGPDPARTHEASMDAINRTFAFFDKTIGKQN